MRSILLVAVAASLLVAVSSSATGRRQLELDAFRDEPAGWVKVGRAEPSDLLTLTVAVKQRNVDKLEELVLRVSDPRSSEYGKHWSMKAVNHLVKPHEDSINTIVNWLTSHGIARDELKHSMASDFVSATVPVSVAERLLHTTYALFRHSETGTEALRVESPYSVPFHIAEHLDFVSPTVRFPSIRALATPSSAPNDLFVTPTFLRSLYQVGNAKGANSTANVQAVASFLEQYWSPADLQTFFKLLQNTSVGATPSQQIGPNDPTNPGVEAELDVQYIMGVGTGVQTWVYYTPGRSPTNPDNEPFLAFLLNLTSSASVPNTISISYGEDEKSVGYDYAVRINTEFAKLGATGVSIMVASGDNGAGGNCTASGRLSPDFPSGSPWVTAVGGVTGGTAGATPTGEVADMISGGGFSDYWARPSWQDEAVTNYMKTASGLPPAANWNQSGRGYPDVAAQSENFLVVSFGIPMPVAGTSCASPTFTAVISLLNELRISQGKSSLGFLNPFIYQTAASQVNSFNDVTVGGNEGCGFGGGFPAFAGWDAATGWGSPNYSILSKAVAKLP